jgi:regulation of enolase protein 1 (concanavalin A-like superfamily)
MTLTLPGVPAALAWVNEPASFELGQDGLFAIDAGARTDLFADPDGSTPIDNAPAALFEPPDARFLLSARVTATFASAFDAAALLLRVGGGRWAKLAFEVSPQLQPMVVSVVTRGVSDDSNGTLVDDSHVYLRLAFTERTIAFHASRDGNQWALVRYFSLEEPPIDVRVGFSAQSPTGQGCRATFAEISYDAGGLGDLRDGT